MNIDRKRLIDNDKGGVTYVIFPFDNIEMGSDDSRQIISYLKEEFGENGNHSIKLMTSQYQFWKYIYTGKYK